MILLAFHLSSAPHAEKQILYYYYNKRNHQDHQNQPQHPNQNQPITQKKRKKKKKPRIKTHYLPIKREIWQRGIMKVWCGEMAGLVRLKV